MKSWIKVGAICEARGLPGVLYQIEEINERGGEAYVRKLKQSGQTGHYAWYLFVNLLRTNKARQEAQTGKFQTEIMKDQDLAQARLLAERHGYVVVRRIP